MSGEQKAGDWKAGIARAFEKARTRWRREHPATRVLIVLALLLLAALLVGPKPWSDGVAAAEAAGESPATEHYAVSGLWIGGVLVLLWLGAVLACRRKLWSAKGPAGSEPEAKTGEGNEKRDGQEDKIEPSGAQAAKGGARLTAFVVLVVAGVTAVVHAPRLQQSLWDDEETTLRRFSVGRVQMQDDGTPRFRETTWTESLFFYPNPNNHSLFSVLAKASHKLFAHPIDTPGKPYFSEAAFRLPAFIAGLLALGAVAWFLRQAGFARAALWAVPLLAIHPWYLRYLVEGRGYAILMLLTPVALGLAIRALRGGRWGSWAALGVVQVLMLFTYPAWAHFLVWLHLGMLAGICSGAGGGEMGGRQRSATRWVGVTRWFVTTSGAAAVTLALLLPLVPQMADFLGSGRSFQPVTAGAMRDLASLFATGTTWHPWASKHPLSLGLIELIEVRPWLMAAVTLLAVAALAGAVRLARRDRATACVIASMILPAVAFPFVSWRLEQPFYNWYVVGLLPGFIAFAALGADWPAAWVARKPGLRIVGTASAAAVILSLALVGGPQRAITTSHPIEPKRDCVEFTRGPYLNPWETAPDEPITIAFHQENMAYDPKAVRLNRTDEQHRFDEVIEQAAADGRTVFVDFAQEGFARLHFEHIFSRLDDETLFMRVAEFHGMEPQNTRVIMKMIPR